MARAMQPVSIDGIEFDALISQEQTLEATVPQYSIEDGFSVSDAIILNPERLSMVLYVTDTPVTWAGRHKPGVGRVDTVCRQLEELYYASKPVSIITSDRTYADMAITSISIAKSSDTGYAREIPISFVKIRTTTAKTATIPASYGKSGTTGASAGSASTSASNTNANGSESGSGSNKSLAKGLIEFGASAIKGITGR